MSEETQTESHGSQTVDGPPPALVVVFAQGAVCWETFPLTQGPVILGRDLLASRQLTDGKVSREHVRIKHTAGVWFLEDLASKNGSFFNGQRITSAVARDLPRVLRIGSTLALLVDDAGSGVQRGAAILGARMQTLRARLQQLAGQSTSLLVVGETGTGKELSARWFHELGPTPGGPFVAVNCAAVPKDLTERLFFGAVRGAYSGATSDSDGYAQAADGGTLFLDEVGEMDLTSQAKLLRLLETREAVRLGEQRGRRVNLRVVAATNQDMQRRVQEGQFRADLFYRLAQPQVQLPPLRERPEEIPFLLDRFAPATLQASHPAFQGLKFLERCLLHPWPGNVRELLAVAQEAARLLQFQGATTSLDAALPAPSLAALPGLSTPSGEDGASIALDRPQVEAVLQSCQGNISRAAKKLGVHRSKLRRFLQREKIVFDDVSE